MNRGLEASRGGAADRVPLRRFLLPNDASGIARARPHGAARRDRHRVADRLCVSRTGLREPEAIISAIIPFDYARIAENAV